MEIIDYSIRAGEPVTKFDRITRAELDSDFVSIPDARQLLGTAYTTYVRKLLLEARIEGVKIQYKGYTKWYISKVSCSHYVRHIGRKRKPRRYTLRIHTTDEPAVRECLDNLGIDYSLELAYKGGK